MTDQVLQREEYEEEPRIYGGVYVNEEALDLPPLFSIYQKIDENRIKIDLE